MKIFILVFSFLALFLTGCSSNSSSIAKKEISTTSAMAPQAHYTQAIAMVESSPDFSDNQKRELTELIGSYATKTKEVKAKETQYKAILVDEMLDGSQMTTMNKRVAKENLSKLNAEDSKNFEQFVKQFQTIAGVSARNQQSLVLQAVDI
jgi:PBP1b-binding outer membrane lipoprotein LpoB